VVAELEQQYPAGASSFGTQTICASKTPSGIIIITVAAITIFFTLFPFIFIQSAVNTEIGGERLITITFRK
jgi:hypothetical protein